MTCRIFPDTTVTREAQFRNSLNTLADPTTVTFTYRYASHGDWKTATPTKTTTGIYTVNFVPEYPGLIYTRWQGTGDLVVSVEDTLLVEPTAFDKSRTTDYCGCW